MKARKLLSVLLSLVLVLGLFPTAAFAATYADTNGHWAEKAIDRWSSYGIVTGDATGFRPNDNMTRAEAATVFSKLFGLNDAAAKTTFTDVSVEQWFYEAINKCVNAGIMNGVGDNRMNPNSPMTREMFFVMFARALGLKEQSTTRGLPADGDSWANGYINALTDKGFVQGMDGKVNALVNINRASVMALLDQTISQYVNTGGTTTLNADKGIVLVNAKNVTLTGTTAADIVIAQGADNGTVAFEKATVTGAVTAQAANAAITSDKDSAITTPVINGANTTYTAAGTAAPAGGGGGGGAGGGGGGGGEEIVTDKTNTTTLLYINGDEDVSDTAMPGYDNVTGDATNGWVVTGPVEITEKATTVTLKGITFEADLTVNGGDSESITMDGVTVKGNVLVTKAEGAMPHIKAETGKFSTTGTVQVTGATGLKLDVADGVKNVETSAPLEVVKGKVENLTVSGTALVVAETGTTLSNVSVASGADTAITSKGTVGDLEAKGSVALSATSVASVTVPSTGNAAKNVDLGNTSVSGTVTIEGANTTIAAEKQLLKVGAAASSVKIDAPVDTLTVTADRASSSVTLTEPVQTLNIPASNNNVASVKLEENATVKDAQIKSAKTTEIQAPATARITSMTATGNVTVTGGAPIEKVTVPEGATVTVSASGSTIKELETEGTTNVSGATVTDLTAKNGSAVTVSDATVATVKVENDSSNAGKAATVTVSGAQAKVAKVEANAPVTVASSGGAKADAVENVVAGAATVTVDASVVKKVETTGSTQQVNVANASNGVEIDVSNGTTAADKPLYIATVASVDNTKTISESGSNSVKVTSSTTNENASLNGTKATVQKKTPEPVVEYQNSSKLKVTVEKTGGTLKIDGTEKTLPSPTTNSGTPATYTYTVDLGESYHNTNSSVAVTYKYANESSGGSTVTYEVSNSVSASYKKIAVNNITIPAGYVHDEKVELDLSNYIVAGTGTSEGTKTYSGTPEQGWIEVKEGKLIYDRTKINVAATNQPSFQIKVVDSGEAEGYSTTVSANITVTIGDTTLKQSTAPTTAAFVKMTGEGKTTIAAANEIKVSAPFVEDGGSYGTIQVYSAATGGTAYRDTVYTVTSGDASNGYATVPLTTKPTGELYVEYTGPFQSASARTATTNYAKPTLTLKATDGNEKSDVLAQVITLSGADATANIKGITAKAEGGFEGFKYELIKPTGKGESLSINESTGAITGTVKAGDTGTYKVKVTDGAGATATDTFELTVYDTTQYPAGIDVTGSNSIISASSISLTATLKTAAGTAPTDATVSKSGGWALVDREGKPATYSNFSITQDSSNPNVAVLKNANTTTAEASTVYVKVTANAKASGADDAAEVSKIIPITVKADSYAVAITPSSASVVSPMSGEEDATFDFAAAVTNNGIAVADTVTWNVAALEGVTLTSGSACTIDSNGVLTIPRGIDWTGTNETISLTVTATSSKTSAGASTAASKTATVTLTRAEKAPAVAPTGLIGTAPTSANLNGAITGVSTAMEYRKSNATSWTAITEGTTVSVTPGTYYVRNAAVAAGAGGAEVPASEAVEVIVPAYTAVLELTANPTALAVPTSNTAATSTITPSLSVNGGEPKNDVALTWSASFGATELTADSTGGITFAPAEGSKTATLSVTKAAATGIMNGKEQIAIRITGTYNAASGETVTAVDYIATVSISVNAELSEIPNITSQPASKTYAKGESASITALSVSASVTDGGTLSYQWYQADDATGANGKKISDATSATYTPSVKSGSSDGIIDPTTAGSYYFYVVVTSKKAEATPATTTSNVATITIAGSSIENAVSKAEVAKTDSALVANDPSWTQDVTVDGKTITVNGMIDKATDGKLLGTAHSAWFGSTYDGGVVLKITAPANATYAVYTPSTATAGGQWDLTKVADGGKGTADDPYYFYYILCLNKAATAGAQSKFEIQWYAGEAKDENKIGDKETYNVVNNVTKLDVTTGVGPAHLADGSDPAKTTLYNSYDIAQTKTDALTSVTGTVSEVATTYTVKDYTVTGTGMVRHTATEGSSDKTKDVYFAGIGLYPTGAGAKDVTKYIANVAWIDTSKITKDSTLEAQIVEEIAKFKNGEAKDLAPNVLETTGTNYNGYAAYDNDSIEQLNKDVMVVAIQWSDGTNTTATEYYVVRFNLTAENLKYDSKEGTYLLFVESDALSLKAAKVGNTNAITPADNNMITSNNMGTSLDVDGATLYVTDKALVELMKNSYTLNVTGGALYMATQTMTGEGDEATTYTAASTATYTDASSGTAYYKLENAKATMTIAGGKVALAFTAVDSTKDATVTAGGNVALSNGINGLYGDYTVGEGVTLKLGTAGNKNAANGDLWYSDSLAAKVSGGYSLYVAGDATFTNNGTIEIPSGAKLIVDSTVTLAGTGKIDDLGTLEIHAVNVTNTGDGLGYSNDLSKLKSAGQTVTIGKASDGDGAINTTYFEGTETAITTLNMIGTKDSFGMLVNKGATLDLTGETPKLIAKDVTVNNCRAPFGRTLKAYDAEISGKLIVKKTAFATMLADGYTYNLKIADGGSLFLEENEAVFVSKGTNVTEKNQNYFETNGVDLTFKIEDGKVTYSFAKSTGGAGEVKAVGDSVSNGYIVSGSGNDAKWLYTDVSLGDGVTLFVDKQLEIAGEGYKLTGGTVKLNAKDAKVIVVSNAGNIVPTAMAGYTLETKTDGTKTIYTQKQSAETYDTLQAAINEAEAASEGTTIVFTKKTENNATSYTAKIGDGEAKNVKEVGTAVTLSKAQMKLDIADAGTFAEFKDTTLTVNAGAELLVSTQPIISATVPASPNSKSGTILTAGSVKIEPKETDPTVTFQNGAKAIIYGWDKDWTAIASSGAEITFPTQKIAGATLTYIKAEINGGASIKIGSGESAYEILGTATSPTNGNYLTVPTGAKVTLGERTLTIASGTVTIPKGKGWITAWNNGADSIYNVSIAENAKLIVDGKLTVLGTIAQEQGGKYGSIVINKGADFAYGDSTIISSKDPGDQANAKSGTYLKDGSVTITNGTLTFGSTAEATVYGWPNTWNAVISNGAKVTLNSLLGNVEGKLTVNAGGALSVKAGASTSPIFLATDLAADAASKEGTYLIAGSVVVDLKEHEVTFGSTAEATVYGWPTGFTAKFESNAKVTVSGASSTGSYDASKTYEWKAKGQNFQEKSTDSGT